MAIISLEGMVNGARLRRCSNEARFLWPYLYLASNGFARLEIDYPRLASALFYSFNPTIGCDQLETAITEYSTVHLLFLYRAGNRLWGQWDTQSKYLPRHKTAADRESPTPPEPDYTNWLREYRFTENTPFPKIAESSRELCHGIGEGGGIGVGVGGGNCGGSVLAEEWPLTAAAVRQLFPATDDPFVVRLVTQTVQVFHSVDERDVQQLTDADIARAVVTCVKKGQRSAGLFLRTVPECIKNWATNPEASFAE